MVYIKLQSYLSSLKEVENRRPESERRQVPTLSDISKEIDIHYTSINRMANNHTKRLHFDTADQIIKAVRKRGFNMKISDLIGFNNN